MTSSCHMKMLRYFCIICLLICIQRTFCYDEIYEKDSKSKRYDRRLGNRVNHHSENVRKKRFQREYEEVDRNPVAEFDVASFIQNPDEEAVDDNQLFGYENTERSRTSKYYNNYGSFGDAKNKNIVKKHENSQDYLKVGADNSPELNLSPPLFKDTMNARHFNLNALSQDEMNSGKIVRSREDKVAKAFYLDGSLIEKNNNYNPEKKCPFKKMKIPFFSRKKSDKLKAKKNKKRKLFCINCPKKDDGDKLTTPLAVIGQGDQTEKGYNIHKRSYQERLCPACKKKFIHNNAQSNNKRRNTKRLFHNSRQYFQDINNLGNDKFKNDIPSRDIVNKENTDTSRKKRDEIEERDRQMKELQEVEKKIDNADIKMPTYQKAEKVSK